MGLLSQVGVYTSVIASMSGVLASPTPPELPQPVVYSMENDTITTRDPVDTTASSLLSSSPAVKQLINGIDISSHQHKNSASISMKKVLNSGEVKFFFIKATEGTHYINPHFRSDTIEVIDSNTPVGFYHYARPSSSTNDARKQARFFVHVTGIDNGVKSLPPVLDLEEDEGLSADELISWTKAFVDEVKTLTGRDVMIYTYPNFWKDSMANTTQFNNLPLWIAEYNKGITPGYTLPGGWNTWTFWQYTSKEEITGIAGDVDGNIFNGSEKQLHNMLK